MRRNISISVLLGTLVLAGNLFSGCKSGTTTSSGQNTNATSSAPAASPKTGFEADLDWVRKGQYTYIWVFSRKDSKPLDKDDADFLRENAPQVVDWVTTDERRKVIAGTNFDLAEGNLGKIQQRLNAEDYTGR
jgi:hypothetical protein